ncbi:MULTISPECIES: ABC transporter substrate-binding protein [unclassified Leucobacter]|uniref:ABC transporter substrate-binding protein n=1 Tax=unclassified Leucobacter TaxID=2621730 RepID=UPI00165DD23D|nr:MULTISPECIES: ABC transporter substrate-binding protein [unclassified Leucobacter]MBC9937095.1 ABC transporter substrate-binding protein [Leucobacter sp. cx-87]
MRKSFLLPLVALAASSLALTGCVSSAGGSDSGDAASETESGKILIGAAIAETGFMSPFDTPAMNSMKIAIDELNANGGIDGKQVELSIIDTASDPEKYAPAAQTLIDEGAKVIIVTCDYDTAYPAAQVAEENNILNIAPCVGDQIYGPAGGLNIGFSMGNGVPGEASVMAEYAFDQGWKNAVFLTDTSIKYTQNQCDTARKRFLELGGTDIGSYDFVQGDKIPESVSKIAGGAAPDVVFNCSYAPGGAQVAKDVRDGGITAPIISGFGMDGTFWFDSIPGLSDYYVVTYPSIGGDDPDPKVNEFVKKYEETYGEAPSVGSFATGPSSLEAIRLAYEDAKSWDGDKLAEAFLNFEDVELLVGPTKFSEDLHINVERPQRVLKITDGKREFIESRVPEKILL